MSDSLATIDEQLQLLVQSGLHDVPWLKECPEVKCVVEVVTFGLVRIRSLERWAELASLNADEAERCLAAATNELWAELEFPRAFLATAKRKPRVGRPLHEVKLPALAVLALFEQRSGPLFPQRGGRRDGGTVVLRSHPDAIELLGQPLFDTSHR